MDNDSYTLQKHRIILQKHGVDRCAFFNPVTGLTADGLDVRLMAEKWVEENSGRPLLIISDVPSGIGLVWFGYPHNVVDSRRIDQLISDLRRPNWARRLFWLAVFLIAAVILMSLGAFLL